MALDEQIAVNGNSASWGYLVFKVDSDRVYGFTAVSFGDKLTEVLGYGMGRSHAPTVRSQGKYEVEPVKITGWKATVQALRLKIAALSETGKSYGSVEVECVLYTVLPGNAEPGEVAFHRMKWIENAAAFEENPDPQKEDFAMQPMWIERDGLVLFDDSEGRP